MDFYDPEDFDEMLKRCREYAAKRRLEANVKSGGDMDLSNRDLYEDLPTASYTRNYRSDLEVDRHIFD